MGNYRRLRHRVGLRSPAGASDRVARLHRDMRASVADAAGFSLMVGLGESYLAAFALAVGLGEVVAGLTATIPILLGSVLQLVSPVAIRWLGSLRRWVVLCAAMQALALIPLSVSAVTGRISAPALMLIATIYWAAGLATGPAWNTWVGQLFPRRIRGSFLAIRSRAAQFAAVVGLIVAGLSLQYGSVHGVTLRVFAGLFLAAAMARFMSATMLWRKSEPATLPREFRLVPVREMISRLRQGHDTGLLTYMLAVSVAVQISGPFFTPYMLKQLHFSYAEYLLLIATSFIAKAIALPLIGRFAQRHGAAAMLWIAGFAIIPLSGFWIVSGSLYYLLGLQVVAGIIWGTYEMATLLLLFDHIRESERTSILTYFNVAHGIAMVVGSIIGGALLRYFGELGQTYHLVFGLSVVARIFTLGLLFGVVKPIHRPKAINFRRFAVRTHAIRPQMGSIDRPVLTSLGDAEDANDPARDPAGARM